MVVVDDDVDVSMRLPPKEEADDDDTPCTTGGMQPINNNTNDTDSTNNNNNSTNILRTTDPIDRRNECHDMLLLIILLVSYNHSLIHSFTHYGSQRGTNPIYVSTNAISLSLYTIQNTIQYNLHRVYMPEREKRERAAAATPHTPTLCRTSAPDRSILLIPSVENIMTLTR